MRLFTFLRNKIKEVCDIHYDTNGLYHINVEDIKIPYDFEIHPPRKEKMNRKRKYYKEHGDFESQVVLKQNLELINGYTTVLLAKELGVRYVECKFVDE